MSALFISITLIVQEGRVEWSLGTSHLLPLVNLHVNDFVTIQDKTYRIIQRQWILPEPGASSEITHPTLRIYMRPSA